MNNNKKIGALVSGAALMFVVSAHAEEQRFELQGFTKLDLSAGVDVQANIGEGFDVRAEGSEKALARLRIEQSGDTLIIGRKRGSYFSQGSQKVRVYVSMPSLLAVDASSGSDLTANGVDSDRFSADVSSGADISISGACGALTVDVSSGADANLRNLKCRTVDADASSGANVTVYASESVNTSASSGGDIDVYGNPPNRDVNAKRSGGVRFHGD